MIGHTTVLLAVFSMPIALLNLPIIGCCTYAPP